MLSLLNQFRRNPAIFMALVSSTIMVVSSFIVPLTVDQQGALNAVAVAAAGIIVAYSVAADGGLALIIGFVKSTIALSISFGLHLTPDKQGVIMAFVATLGAVFVHSNVTASVTAAGNSVTVDSAGKAVVGPPA